jgi:7-cyano-7-deazaguanine synthase
MKFYEAIDQVVSLQEGHISVEAPGIASTTVELIRESKLGPPTLGYTYSCHRGNFPCYECPGCYKRQEVFAQLGMFQSASS